MLAVWAPTPGHTTRRASAEINGIIALGSSRWKTRTAMSGSLGDADVEIRVRRAGPADDLDPAPAGDEAVTGARLDVDHGPDAELSGLFGLEVADLGRPGRHVVDGLVRVTLGNRRRARPEHDVVQRAELGADARPHHGAGR